MQKQVYIVHGFDAHPNKHWFSWLKSELEKEGAAVKVLELPSAQNPNLSEWLETLRAEVKPGANTYLVGHSLGCITILRYLESLKTGEKVGGVVLVSGFYEKLSILPQLDGFVRDGVEFEKVVQKAGGRVVISARDDQIVPTSLSENLAKRLKATFVQTETGGHFMESEGVKTMPWALMSLKALF